ncbi:MAG: alpha/beta hydrolase-fold protein [Chloroflexota bacterium]
MHTLRPFLLSLYLLLLGGCLPTQIPPALPTLLPIATVPATAAQAAAIPPTFTPTIIPSPTLFLPTATPTPQPPTATPEPPTATPTPDIIPDFLVAATGEIPELEVPPMTTDCDGTGFVFRSRFPSQVGGGPRPYSAYLPPCYGQNGRSYPTLYLFHGSIQTDSHFLDLGLAHHLDEGIANGRYPPFVVIMPFNGNLGNITSGGPKSVEAITVEELLPFVDANFCTWEDRAGRSLGGISRGGYWALMIAFRHTDLFTAVAGHSSHLRYETDGEKYNPLSTYATADLSNMRIWLDWGETDFLRTGQQQLVASLAEAGIPHDATVNGGGHNDAYWQVHLREYLDWHAAVWPRDRDFYPVC